MSSLRHNLKTAKNQLHASNKDHFSQTKVHQNNQKNVYNCHFVFSRDIFAGPMQCCKTITQTVIIFSSETFQEKVFKDFLEQTKLNIIFYNLRKFFFFQLGSWPKFSLELFRRNTHFQFYFGGCFTFLKVLCTM